MNDIRTAIIASDSLNPVIRTAHQKEIDVENDEVYELEETYKDVSLTGRYVNGNDVYIGIRLRLDQHLTDALTDELREIFSENGYSFDAFSIDETDRFGYYEYSITNDHLTEIAIEP